MASELKSPTRGGGGGRRGCGGEAAWGGGKGDGGRADGHLGLGLIARGGSVLNRAGAGGRTCNALEFT